jgi:hypothetical protein
MWPWPQPTDFESLDGGRPFVRFVFGLVWKAN